MLHYTLNWFNSKLQHQSVFISSAALGKVSDNEIFHFVLSHHLLSIHSLIQVFICLKVLRLLLKAPSNNPTCVLLLVSMYKRKHMQVKMRIQDIKQCLNYISTYIYPSLPHSSMCPSITNPTSQQPPSCIPSCPQTTDGRLTSGADWADYDIIANMLPTCLQHVCNMLSSPGPSPQSPSDPTLPSWWPEGFSIEKDLVGQEDFSLQFKCFSSRGINNEKESAVMMISTKHKVQADRNVFSSAGIWS